LAAASAAQAAKVVADPVKAQEAADKARDDAACSTLATQQTGYDPAQAAAQAQAEAQNDSQTTKAAKKGKKFVGKIPVTTLIGGPKSIAMGAATGLAGSQLAKSNGAVGDAASGAANVMSKVPIPTTEQVVGAAEKTVGGKKDDPAKAYQAAHTNCMRGKGYAVK
jgi:hypothetical protein